LTASTARTRVLLVDDHALFREGLSLLIGGQADLEVVGEASDGLEAIVKTAELKPDLVLMDIQMPGCDGLEATRRIKQQQPQTVVVMLTVRGDDEKLFEAIKNGAQGYLLKNLHAAELMDMLRRALAGEAAISPGLAGRMFEEFRRLSALQPRLEAEAQVELSQREQEILGWVAQGQSDKEIAARLSLSVYTVKTHLRNILSKLQVSGRKEAARLARDKGLV
jgi:two-component system, NarL family, nitrate/nitrite response regulator NarL